MSTDINPDSLNIMIEVLLKFVTSNFSGVPPKWEQLWMCVICRYTRYEQLLVVYNRFEVGVAKRVREEIRTSVHIFS